MTYLSSVELPRPPDLVPKRERLLELGLDLRPRLGAPARVQHHAQDAVDAEPGMPETGVGVVHFTFGPRGSTVSGTFTTATSLFSDRPSPESSGTTATPPREDTHDLKRQ